MNIVEFGYDFPFAATHPFPYPLSPAVSYFDLAIPSNVRWRTLTLSNLFYQHGDDSLIKSAAFSPIIIVGALVFPDGIVGIIDASTTRNPSMPRTRS